jgi:hypothetical protein
MASITGRTPVAELPSRGFPAGYIGRAAVDRPLTGCGAVLGAKRFHMAVDRSVLPSGADRRVPFPLQVAADGPGQRNLVVGSNPP